MQNSQNTKDPWQLYNEQGQPLAGRGADKAKVFADGLLHGAAHVWIWRKINNSPEILLQKRAANKHTWPNVYDISAAGHIDLGEEPSDAAIRETKEEIGLVISRDELKLISLQRVYMIAPSNAIENEFQWLYLLRLKSEINLTLEKTELDSIEWIDLSVFKSETLDVNSRGIYLPHGDLYYSTVINALELELSKLS